MKTYFSPPTSHLSPQRGFTLIELLVVVAIIAVLTSLGIASYSTYNSTQVVQTAAADVSNMLSTAKSRAISQVKPSSCSGSLTAYQVTIDASQQQYVLSATCGGTNQIVTTKSLPPQVSFDSSSSSSIVFAISSGTVASVGTIKLSGFDKTKTITVSQTGSISTN